MVRTIEIEIAGAKHTLRRSAKNGGRAEKRFGGFSNLGAYAEKSVEGKVETLTGVLWELMGQPATPTVEEIADSIDLFEIGSLVDQTIDFLFGDQPAYQALIAAAKEQANDPRSLAPFVPTPEAMVERMLDVAMLEVGEIFIDPCCGDGRTLKAARIRGATVVGFETNEERFEICSTLIKAWNDPPVETTQHAGGSPFRSRHWVMKEDGRKAPFSKADVIFLYTLPASNVQLQPFLTSQCKHSCRIVSHAFDMPGWPKAHEEDFEGKRFYMWRMGEVRAALNGISPEHVVSVYRAGEKVPIALAAAAD